MENNKEKTTFCPSGAEQQEVSCVEGNENVQNDEMNIDSLTPEPNTMTQVQAPFVSQAHYIFQAIQEQERANIDFHRDLYEFFHNDNDNEGNDNEEEDNDNDLYDAPPSIANHVNGGNIGDNTEEVNLNNHNGNVDEDPVESRAPIDGNIGDTNVPYNNVPIRFSWFDFQNLRQIGATIGRNGVHVGQRRNINIPNDLLNTASEDFCTPIIHHHVHEGQQWNTNRHNDLYDDVDLDIMTYEELCALGDAIGIVSKGLSSESITLLERFTYVYDSNDEESGLRKDQSMCVICLYEFEHGDKIIKLPCKHEYHSRCLLQWLQDNKVCPICNDEVNPTSSTPKDSTNK